MDQILCSDVIKHMTSYLDNNELFFFIHTCKYFYDMFINSRVKFPSIDFIFRNAKNFEFLYEFKDFKISRKCFYKYAVKYGRNLDILDYVYDNINGKQYLDYKIFWHCIKNKNICKIEWMKEHRCPYNEHLRYKTYFDNDNVNLMKWVNTELIWEESQFFDFVKHNRNLNDIRWVLNSVPSLKENICEIASQLNDFDLLKWGIKHNYKITKLTPAFASRNGNMEMLQYLYKNDCEWNAWTTTEASENGYFEILKWAYERGCPLESYALIGAMSIRNFEIISWLIKNKCPIDYETQKFAYYNKIELKKI